MNLCFVTGSRAEFGILSNLIVEISNNSFFKVKLVVTGSHLSKKYGLTYREILSQKFNIYKKIKILTDNTSDKDISKVISSAINNFSKFFKKEKFESIIVLGDRAEILGVVLAAYCCQIPVIHFHGGETTIGSMDNGFRNAISQLSQFHFCATLKSKKKLLNMGFNFNKIFNVGSLSLDSLSKKNLLSKKELEKRIKIKLNIKYIVVNFFPETNNSDFGLKNLKKVLINLEKLDKILIVFTLSSFDFSSSTINKLILEFQKKKEMVIIFKSLGHQNYLSLLKYSELIVGNSSSGIIEFPFFKKVTINVGNRQEGREQANSVVNLKKINDNNLYKLIKKLLLKNNNIKNIKNPYFNSNSINSTILNLKKIFYESKNST
jgi:GDP/UDP-N,N'-diacetylbacillosamine 2-epimerase (hydrolysing)